MWSMTYDEPDYEVHREMLRRVNPDNAYEFLREFSKTGTMRYSDRRRHFRGILNKKNLWIRPGVNDHPEIILHNTVIARVLPVGIRLATSGWYTFITKQNMNNFIVPLCEMNLSQIKHEWWVYPNNWWLQLKERGIEQLYTNYNGATRSQVIKRNKEIRAYRDLVCLRFDDNMIVPFSRNSIIKPKNYYTSGDPTAWLKYRLGVVTLAETSK